MFSRRASGPELIDSPEAAPRLVAQSYAFMALVNRCFGGTRIVRRFVADEAAMAGGRLRVLDIGPGGCDIPLAVSRWAARRGLDVQFTCVEASPQCAAIACEKIRRRADDAVTLVENDILRYQPAEPFDCAVGSMLFHHFDDDGILKLIEHVRPYVARSLLINDLWRGWPTYAGAALLSVGWPSGVRHDALLSVRRGFRASELGQLLGCLDGVSVSVDTAWLFRVRAIVRFNGRASR